MAFAFRAASGKPRSLFHFADLGGGGGGGGEGWGRPLRKRATGQINDAVDAADRRRARVCVCVCVEYEEMLTKGGGKNNKHKKRAGRTNPSSLSFSSKKKLTPIKRKKKEKLGKTR